MQQSKKFHDVLQKLSEIIDTSHRAGHLRLPTIKELAIQIGTSSQTVWKAVTVLKQQGVLSARPNCGLIILSSGKTGSENPLAASMPISHRLLSDKTGYNGQLKWENLLERMEYDLLTGRFLPPSAESISYKEIRQKYGVCHKTLMKTIRILLQKNAIQRYKRGVAPVNLSRLKKAGNTIVFITHMSKHPIQPQPFGTFSDSVPREIEMVCLEAGLKLFIVPCLSDAEDNNIFPAQERKILEDPEFNANVLGYFVWTRMMPKPLHLKIVNFLLKMKKPISVLNEYECADYSSAGTLQKLIRHYDLQQNFTAGNAVGRYLFSLGHRNIAFVSLTHNNPWSIARQDGLRCALSDVGHKDAVVPYTMLHSIEDFGISGETSHLLPPMADTLDLICKQIHFSRQETALYKRLLVRKLSESNSTYVLWRLTSDFMEKIIATKTITCIVAVNDSTALACLDWLNLHNIEIPQRISVIGFDNTAEGRNARLTSYDFNIDKIVRAMLAFILNPPWSKQVIESGVKIYGSIIPRCTTGIISRIEF